MRFYILNKCINVALTIIQARESMRILQKDSIRNFSIFSDRINQITSFFSIYISSFFTCKQNKPASYFITTIIIVKHFLNVNICTIKHPKTNLNRINEFFSFFFPRQNASNRFRKFFHDLPRNRPQSNNERHLIVKRVTIGRLSRRGSNIWNKQRAIKMIDSFRYSPCRSPISEFSG